MKKLLFFLSFLFSCYCLYAQENIALNKSITASTSNGGNTPNKAVDGDANDSRWESIHGEDNQWIEIDLGDVYDLTSSKVFWEGASAASYEIMISSDAEEWKSIATRTSNVGKRTDDFSFGKEGKEARYVRLNLYTRVTQYGFSIYEWEVYGVPANVVSVPSGIDITPKEVTLLLELPEEPLILSLNNSLIDYNDQPSILKQLASSAGKTLNWTKHTNLGQPLSYHYQEEGNGSAKAKIASTPWTHIILQEQSNKPITDPTGFHESVRLWMKYIKEYCPNPYAEIILTLNWPYTDSSDFSGDMEKLYTSYQTIAEELGVTLCPVGYTYKLIYEKDGVEAKNKLYTDNRHPSELATYLSACTLYSTLFNASPAGLSYSPSAVSQEDALRIQNHAWDAYLNYENIVNHHHKKVTYSYILLDQFNRPLETVASVNWNVSSGGEIIDGIFSSNLEEGSHTITAQIGGFSATALVHAVKSYVEEPETYFIQITKEEPYIQDFDAIGTEAEAALPIGWKIEKRLDAPRIPGSYRFADKKTEQAGGNNIASNAKNGIYNFGAGEAGTATDRAIGGISTDASGGARGINIYLKIKNTSNSRINSLDIKYDVEKYRKGMNSAGFMMQMYYSKDGENWQSAGEDFYTYFAADHETAGYASTPGDTRTVTANLGQGLNVNEELYLAWNYSVNSGTSAQGAQALGLDNVEIKASEYEVKDYAVISWKDIYKEDFDGIGTSQEAELPLGWKIEKRLDAPRTLGTYISAKSHTEQIGGNNIAADAKNGIYNFGAGNEGTATDRAIGGISTGIADGTRGINMYLKIRNKKENPIHSLDIQYDIEKYRKGNNAAGFMIQMYYSKDGVNWVSAGDEFYTYFANDSQTVGYNEAPGETVNVQGILNQSLAGEEELYLAWNYSVASGNSAQGAQALGLDNVIIKAKDFTNLHRDQQTIIWDAQDEETGTQGGWAIEGVGTAAIIYEENEDKKSLLYSASNNATYLKRDLTLNLGKLRRISMSVKAVSNGDSNAPAINLGIGNNNVYITVSPEETNKWQKIVYDFSQHSLEETPPYITISALADEVLYISNITLEGDPHVNGIPLDGIESIATEKHLNLTGSWLTGEGYSSEITTIITNDFNILKEKLQGNTQLTSVDLREINSIVYPNNIFAEERTKINPNCLIYTTEAIPFPGDKNIIIDGIASNIELKDRYRFNSPYEFYAENIVYERNCYFDGGWETLVLPFELEGIKEGDVVLSTDEYVIESFETLKENVIVFKKDLNLSANTPAIFKFYNGQSGEENRDFKFYGSNQYISSTSYVSFDDIFKGTYHTSAGENKFLLNETGSAFGKGSSTATVPAFRSYIENSSSDQTRYVVKHADENPTGIDTDFTNELEIVIKDNTVNIQVTCPQTLFIHSIDGKFIHSIKAVAGTYSFELPKGFYLINNNKAAIH